MVLLYVGGFCLASMLQSSTRVYALATRVHVQWRDTRAESSRRIRCRRSSSYFQCWRSLTTEPGPRHTMPIAKAPANGKRARYTPSSDDWSRVIPTRLRSSFLRRRKFIVRNLDWITPQQRPRPACRLLARANRDFPATRTALYSLSPLVFFFFLFVTILFYPLRSRILIYLLLSHPYYRPL